MPTIFDNIQTHLLPTLRSTLEASYRADICVGYFNLRGWKSIQDLVDHFDGSDNGRARILIGMYQSPDEEMRRSVRLSQKPDVLDGPAKARLHRRIADSFRQQLELGAPSNEDEETLRRLAAQIREKKVQVKLFLRHALHAKLYLGYRHDQFTPILGYVGSSNLTSAGLSRQGELNVDVLEQDASQKLSKWFQERWQDSACIDISDELATLIENSWARGDILSPYLVYLKMLYHLAEEAREGEREFKLPRAFRGQLLDFQAAAVSLAVRHLNMRGGVLVGDVVGLGKTRVAAAVAKIYEEDQDANTLILCPKNLVPMWRQQVELYDLKAEVLSISRVQRRLPELRRYKLVLIDESHNLRNREGKRYQIIRDYIERNDSRCILLTATPYNKQYLDLSNQLRLFVEEKRDLGVRPERFFKETDELDFMARFQAPVRSLTAFEKSTYPEDWRDLLRLFMVRRTRQFIIQNYAAYEPTRDRYYVMVEGEPFYFPKRQALNLEFQLDDTDPQDQYAALYQDHIVDVINNLRLPRYGLGNYENKKTASGATAAEKKVLENLGRAGPRLMGFCRTNLFKRLESSGYSFLLSLERHVLRNLITLHAIETGQPIPIGTQETELLDSSRSDADLEAPEQLDEGYVEYNEDGDTDTDVEVTQVPQEPTTDANPTWEKYRARAVQVYEGYQKFYKTRFKWIDPQYFTGSLARDLKKDAESLLKVLKDAGPWDPSRDAKLAALEDLLCGKHLKSKVLVFTQFADTARYLERQLQARGIQNLEAVTGQSSDPTSYARRFSPRSNQYDLGAAEKEIRVLVATDALSEGQNLQDSAMVVSVDLPWAIIRLIQRAGRVDRIGQKSDTIQVYSFLPAAGVERVIRLQRRLTQRLLENQEVVGSDEAFFGDVEESKIRDLYTEKSQVLDEDGGQQEVDLASAALQLWKNAVKDNPGLRAKVQQLPNVVYATRPHGSGRQEGPPGVLVYLKTQEGADALARVDASGKIVTQSLSAILDAAACPSNMPGLPRHPKHHELVQTAVQQVLEEGVVGHGALGRPRSARRRAWERLTHYREKLKKQPSLFVSLDTLEGCIQAIFKYPLTAQATDQINRQLRTNVSDEDLAQLVVALHDEGKLSVVQDEPEEQEPRILCSMGLFPHEECEDTATP